MDISIRMADLRYQPQPVLPSHDQSAERGFFEGLLHGAAILRGHWKMILFVTAGAAVAVTLFCAATLKLPPRINPLPDEYSADAALLVRQGAAPDLSPAALSSLAGDAAPAPQPTQFQYPALLLRMLDSRVILDQIASEFDLARRYHVAANVRTRTRQALRHSARFTYAPDTGVLSISFQDTDPAVARDVANRFVSLLDDWSSRLEGSLMQSRQELLAQKIVEVQASVDSLSAQVKAMQSRYGFLAPSDLGPAQATTLSDLRSQLILKDIEIKNYSDTALVDDPHLVNLKKEGQNLVDLIQQVEAGSPLGLPSDAPGKGTSAAAQQFASLVQQLDVQKGIYASLSKAYEIARLSADPQPAFRVLELAEAPDMKSGPQRSRIVLLVVLLAFAGSVCYAFLLNSFRKARALTRGDRGAEESRPASRAS